MNKSGKGRVAGKVVLVTGGARNQGLGHGGTLASEGASVILADVADEAGDAAAGALAREGYPVRYLHLDVDEPSILAGGHQRHRVQRGPP